MGDDEVAEDKILAVKSKTGMLVISEEVVSVSGADVETITVTVEPEPEETYPYGPPRSVEELAKRISDEVPKSYELVVVSDRGDYFRVGKKKRLKDEVEYKVDAIVAAAGGSWDEEKNAWSIPKQTD